jgi:hypothetical protein
MDLNFGASKNEVQPKTFSAAKCLVVVDIVDTVPELNDIDDLCSQECHGQRALSPTCCRNSI